MTEKKQVLLDYLKNAEEALRELNEMGYYFLDDKFVWKVLIYKLNHIEIPSDVLWHRFTKQEIFEQVSDYFNDCGVPVKEIVLDSSVIPNDFPDDLIKARVKFKGEVWTIHKNDKDCFPSNPHAHNYDRQVKLHLGDGTLFRNRIEVGSISKKKLKLIRERIKSQTNLKLP